jgi:cytosine/adenosine deaminase-related metal-dependent hydrolase
MTTLLIHRARCIATQDDANTERHDASLLIRGGRIERIIPATENTDELVKQVDEVIDARRHVVVPGLINTHHHMYQSLTRAIPGVQNAELFSWLQGLYPAAPPALTTSTSTPTACGWTTASKRRTPWACASRPHAAA